MGERYSERRAESVTGKCLQCGKCCRAIACNKKGLAPETREWLIARGASDEGEYLVLPHVCAQLNADNTCKIHDAANYPRVCARYHGFGNYWKPPGCGYI